jgi:hypothetical protein
MAERKRQTTGAGTAKRAGGRAKQRTGWSAEEKAAAKAYSEELKRRARRGKATREDGQADVEAAIAALPGDERTLVERLHTLITKAAPELWPRTWYGMPAYARDDKVVCFVQPASKFKARYATLGFTDKAALDDGVMWPAAFAVARLTAAAEKEIVALVKRAAG